MPRLWHILVARFRVGNGPGNGISPAAIRPHRDVPRNSQRLVRDFRGFMGKARPVRRQYGRPSFCTLISAKDSAFSAILVDPISDGTDSENGLSLAEIRVRKEGPVNSQRLARDFLKFLGESRPIRHQSGWPSFCALISAKNGSFPGTF